jgi:hypothetical protein
VVVKKVTDGGALSNARVQNGFIITSVITGEGPQEITSLDQLNEILQNAVGTVRLQGVYPGYSEPYTYPLNLGQ